MLHVFMTTNGTLGTLLRNVNLMQRSGQTLFWPSRKDDCWVPYDQLLCSVGVPTLQGQGGRQSKLGLKDYNEII